MDVCRGEGRRYRHARGRALAPGTASPTPAEDGRAVCTGAGTDAAATSRRRPTVIHLFSARTHAHGTNVNASNQWQGQREFKVGGDEPCEPTVRLPD